MSFDRHALDLNAQEEAGGIVSRLVQSVRKTMRKNGAVVGVSGGVDSALVLALCARGFGPERVKAILMPERDSDPDTERLARMVAERYGVESVLEDISGCLDGFQCYRRRDEAIRRVFPEFDAARGYRAKIVLPQDLLDEGTLNVFSLTVLAPDGRVMTKSLPPRELSQIIAASNFKQRTRMSLLYYHAELNNYAVVGTPNKNEHELGFFVKYGDGGADVRPIAHLYKTQVYQLAGYLGVPEPILRREPTTDTYSAPTTQQEFFFRLPFATLDLLWYAMDSGVPMDEVTSAMSLTEVQVRRAYDDFARKRRTTEYLRLPPLDFSDAGNAGVFRPGARAEVASQS